MKQVCILIIDDDREDQHILREALETLSLPEGAVHFVENGKSAIEFLSQGCNPDELPHLIVLDLNLPKFSGVETLRTIKANKVLRNIPVIIFSSSSDPLDMEEAKREGATDYISKPGTFVQYKEIAEKFASYVLTK